VLLANVIIASIARNGEDEEAMLSEAFYVKSTVD
jgi:hypothetical protein